MCVRFDLAETVTKTTFCSLANLPHTTETVADNVYLFFRRSSFAKKNNTLHKYAKTMVFYNATLGLRSANREFIILLKRVS